MLADIDLVDDTSSLYTVRCAYPAKNATSQLYTTAGRSSSAIMATACQLSCLLYLCSGIVQGSVIGPLLFMLFINDIIDIFSDGVCKLFADDAKIYVTLDINDDGVNLSDKLKCVVKWCSDWQ